MGLASSAIIASISVNPACQLSCQAQSNAYGSFNEPANVGPDQDSLLPPEVVPVDSRSFKGTGSPQSGDTQAQMSAPGLVPNSGQAPIGSANEMQSAQDFRKAMMDSLAGKGNYPQFQNHNPFVDQSGQGQQPINQIGNQAFANNAGSPPLGQSDWITPNQGDNTMPSAVPPQTQTLTGGVRVPSTPYQGGNQYAHGLGMLSSLGMTLGTGLFAIGSGRGGAGAAYGLGYTGAALLNYGAHTGFRF